ncbi:MULTISPECIES: IPT/TIG domain-containing protein [unclassified Janthinobacterium]|uniref:IPT/TIG domain-containing protein n=1 Tax=unclassified Janthinobacterium TaxID=2610881 RepID=UPI0012F731DD|nr:MULTISPECIES: IPT/TIG domain-containing protein [unclassified Janthinobacterium]MEC5163541.1 hypothetical protein [Janthinobacterium sp. CG_S6]
MAATVSFPRAARPGAAGPRLALAACFLLGLSACGGGGADGAAPVAAVAPAAVATLTGVSGNSAVVGGSIVVTGTNLNLVDAFRLGDLALAASNRTPTSATLTMPATPASGVLTMVVGSTSLSSDYRIDAYVAVAVTAITPSAGPVGSRVTVSGRGLAGVTAVRFSNGVAATLPAERSDASLSFPVPPGAASGKLSLTGAYNALTTDAAFDVLPAVTLAAGGLEFAQVFSRRANDPQLLLTQDKAVVVRAAVLAAAPGRASPAVSLSAYAGNGVLLGRMAMTGPAELPLARDDYRLDTTFNALLQGAWVRPGLTVRVTVGEGAAAVTLDATPPVAAATAIRIVLVPLRTPSGVTVSPSMDSVNEQLARIYPYATSSITVAQRQPLTVSGSSADLSWWHNALAELEEVRKQEDPTAFYYGLAPTYTNPSALTHTAGMAYLTDRDSGRGATSALGVDATWRKPSATDPFGNNWPLWLTVMLHELGHNHSLKHVDCGAPENVDTDYPYPNGDLGDLPLYDSVYRATTYLGGLDAPRAVDLDGVSGKMKDVMSYCDGAWLSDFSYLRAQQFSLKRAQAQAQAPARVMAKRTAALADGYLSISGSISRGALLLRPAMASSARLHQEVAGQQHAYVLRVVTVAGQTFDQPLETQLVADSKVETRHFWASLPNPGPVASIEVLYQGKPLARPAAAQTPAGKRAAAPGVASFDWTLEGGRLALTWNAAVEPQAAVLHIAANGQKTVLANALSGGSAALDVSALPVGGRFEVSLATTSNARLLSIPHH